MKPLIGAALILVSSAANATTPFDLYAQGRYDQAIEAGLRENDVAGFALAARSELAAEMMRDEPCLDCLERAAGYARQAIASGPGEPESHIYLAVTLGYEARIIGPIAARFKQFPTLAKEQIDAALADDPKDAWAWAALGGWNFEIVRGGGKTLASWLYDATLDKGMSAFQRAFALDPSNFVLRYQYALTLSAFDRKRFQSDIASALASVASAHPKTAYESFAQARGRALLAALNTATPKAYLQLVRHDQGYP